MCSWLYRPSGAAAVVELTPTLIRERLDRFYRAPEPKPWVHCLCGLWFPEVSQLTRHVARVERTPKRKIHKAHGLKP